MSDKIGLFTGSFDPMTNGHAENVMVVCETDKSVELPEEIACLGIWKEKIYGISKVTVYVR